MAKKSVSLQELGYGVETVIKNDEVSYGPDVREQYVKAEELFVKVTRKVHGVTVTLDRPNQLLTIKETRRFAKNRTLEFDLRDSATEKLQLLRKTHSALIGNEKEMFLGIKQSGGSILKAIRIGECYYKDYWDILAGKPRVVENQVKRGKKVGGFIGGVVCFAFIVWGFVTGL